ncbi:MAG: hypothetical protein ACREVQ_15820 [Burkholderiales bacterium]
MIILSIAWTALFLVHLIIWLIANPRAVTSTRLSVPSLIASLEILLFLASVVLGCLAFLGSHAFPSVESWTNQAWFGGTVASWICMGVLFFHRRKPLREIPAVLVLLSIAALGYLVLHSFWGGSSVLLAGMMLGVFALAQNVGPIIVGFHVLLQAAHLNRRPTPNS